MRIVHLARDEKFVPLLRRLWEIAQPGANHWVIAQRRRARAAFVEPGSDVTFRSEWRFRTRLIAADVAHADVILAHSMTSIFANAIHHAPPSARVVWKGWGYDYYPLLAAQLGDPILPLTRVLMGGASSTDGEAADADERTGWWQRLLGAGARKRSALERVAARLHTFCVIPTEVAMVRKALPALTAVHHELPLFTTEDVFASGPLSMDGPDVLLGNSATASNNHVDAMALLEGRLGDGRIVVPLSYGNAGYGAKVAARGRELFADRLDALRDWMSLADYNARIQRCGFVFMNHRRQQAVGNIGAALYKGATVYLRTENPLYGFYAGLGIHLRSVDELASGGGPLVPLSEGQRHENRTRIGAHYARARVVQAMRELPALRS